MEPQAAIAVIEVELRALVRTLVAVETWKAILGDPKVEELTARLEEERRRRKPSVVSNDLLQYTHFYEIRKIISSNWDVFKPALGKKSEFEVWADQVEDFRNAPAHSRELLPSERLLLEGIAGSIRTRVTVFRSSQDSNLDYYPVIESVVDSFGNELTDLSVTSPFGGHVSTNLIVRPGDVLIYHARGWDPQGRDLTWTLAADGITFGVPVVGNEVDLEWTVRDQDVGLHRHIYVAVKSSSLYHRHTSYDHEVSFLYRVDPPDRED